MSCVVSAGFWQLGQGASMPAKAWVAQELMQRAWEKKRADDAQPAPWPWAHTVPIARLSAGNGNVSLVVLAGDTSRTLAFGPNHLPASAKPGEAGNTVIAGHRDTHFAFLRDLDEGDALVLETTQGVRHLYRVASVDIVDARRAHFPIHTQAPTLSLVTGYPFETGESDSPLRYVVTAKMLF